MKNLQIKFCILILVVLYSFVFFADYIAPYNPCEQNNQASYAEPAKIGIDTEGIFIYKEYYRFNPFKLSKERAFTHEKIHLRFFTKEKLINTVNKKERVYLLGTDQLGRDNLSRLIHGARPSLTVGFLALLIAFPIGTLYGAVSAYSGKFIDNILMRLAEALMSFPSFYLLIILAALLPASLSNIERFSLITIILSFTSWAGLSRVIRGILLSIKEENYISAAKLMGVNSFRIIRTHLIPQSFSYIIVAATLSIPGFIIGESALSFLGFGINQPDPSWGNILSEAKELSNLFHRPHMLFYPSLMIFLAVYSYNVLGDYLRDRLDVAH